MKLSFLLFNAFAYFNFMWGSPGLLDAFLANAFVQVVIFISIGCLPAMIFKRIWVSDIAYSAGISCIGLQILFAFPTSGIMRNTLIGGAYLLIGIKHLVMCLYRVFSGQWSGDNPDLSKYRYVEEQCRANRSDPFLQHQGDMLTLCALSSTILSTPALVIGMNGNLHLYPFSIIEIILYALGIISFFLEIYADYTKFNWSINLSKKESQTKVCRKGLWNSCRHPNYFFHLLTWSVLSLLSLFSVYEFYPETSLPLKYFFFVQTVLIPVLMYVRLTNWMGATPTEYYSVIKRPLYKEYIESVPCFFPKELHIFKRSEQQNQKEKNGNQMNEDKTSDSKTDRVETKKQQKKKSSGK